MIELGNNLTADRRLKFSKDSVCYKKEKCDDCLMVYVGSCLARKGDNLFTPLRKVDILTAFERGSVREELRSQLSEKLEKLN